MGTSVKPVLVYITNKIQCGVESIDVILFKYSLCGSSFYGNDKNPLIVLESTPRSNTKIYQKYWYFSLFKDYYMGTYT